MRLFSRRLVLLFSATAAVNGLEMRQPPSRRDFIAGATAGASGLTALPGLGGCSPAAAAVPATAASALASSAGAASATSGAGAAAVSPLLTVSDGGRVTLPPMGLGAWAWGDALFWGYRPSEDGELRKVFDYAVTEGPGGGCLFDTAELYGLGRSESLIGGFAKQAPLGSRVSVATKFAALPWRTTRAAVVEACERSAARLGPDTPIDLYQIHFPGAWANEAYWDGLGDCFEKGLVRAVGVSNYGSAALRACHAQLAARGIPLATNQVQLSLLYRCPLENGLAATCAALGVQLVGYSPLALGLLTGKYAADGARPAGPRGKLAADLFQTPGPDGVAGSAFTDLTSAMRAVARHHGDAPLCQVALNWVRAKGAVPIPGARTVAQARANLGALTWDLSADEVAALDAAAAPLPPLLPPEKAQFPKVDKDTGLVMFDS